MDGMGIGTPTLSKFGSTNKVLFLDWQDQQNMWQSHHYSSPIQLNQKNIHNEPRRERERGRERPRCSMYG